MIVAIDEREVHRLVLTNPFFGHPILNAPYELPQRHWELGSQGQPTQQVLERRRRAEFITPIPKPTMRSQARQQAEMVFDEGKGLSTKEQQYDPTSIINEVRQNVDRWRAVSNPSQWQVSRDIALKIHPDAFGVAPVGFEGSG